jgi:hypothetical protein
MQNKVPIKSKNTLKKLRKTVNSIYDLKVTSPQADKGICLYISQL